MKESRSSLLVALSTLLLILSVTLLGIWGYNYYKSKQEVQPLVAAQKQVSSNSIQTTKDSLQQIYTQTISQLDSTWTNADSLKNTLDVKLSDFYKLRSEITDILKNNPSTADLGIAKQKIQELQLRLEILRNKNNDIESENKRLNALLKQYASGSKKSVGPSFPPTEKMDVLEDKTPSSSGLFAASQIKIMALSAEGENETTTADDVEKITGTFVVKNTSPFNGAEIIIVVTQPNGKVLKNSAWETGIFETKEDGRKMYSQKIRFDYSKGEAKRCNFSVTADKYPKGNYTFQIYHNGVLIANTVKTLS